MQNQMLAEQCRAFVRAFKNAWHAEVGQNPRYSIVDYNDRDLLVRCASGQITGGHRMETDLFLIRRNMGVPVGYDRRVFLELKSGVTVQTCGDLRAIRPVIEGKPSTELPTQPNWIPSNVNSYNLAFTGVRKDWFSHRTIEPRYEAARDLYHRIAYEHISPVWL